MSSSKDKEIKESEFHADDLRRRTRRHQLTAPLWQIFSFTVHLLAFALLVLCTPVRELVIPEKKESTSTMSKMSAKQIEDMSENIQNVYHNDIVERLETLKDMLESIENMREQMLENYDQVATKEAEHAPDSMTELVDAIVGKMEDAVRHQDELENKVRNDVVPSAQSSNLQEKEARQKYYENSYKAQNLLIQTASIQADTQSLLDAAANMAELVGMDEVAKIAENLRKVQLDANIAQSDSQTMILANRTAVDKLSNSTDTKNRQTGDLEKINAELANKVAEKREWEAKRTEAANSFEEAKRSHNTAQENLRKAEEKKKISETALRNAEQKKDSNDKIDQLRNERRSAESELNSAQNAKRNAENDERRKADSKRNAENRLHQIDNRIAQLKNDESRRKNEISAAEKEINDAKQTILRETPKLVSAQKKAGDLQKALVEVTKSLAEKIPTQATTPKNASEEFERAEAPSFMEFTAMDVADAYDAAKSLELAVSESYRSFKATELAVRQKMSLKGASDLIDVAKPERGEVDKDILRTKPVTEAEFIRRKEATQQTVREVEKMVENANSILENVYAIAEPYCKNGESSADFSSSSLDRIYALSEIDAAMSDASAESSSEKSKDISNIMKMAGDAMSAGPEGKNGKKSFEKSAAGDGTQMKKAGVKITTGGFGKMSYGKPGKDPSISNNSPGQVPGNIIGDGGVPCEWMYINSWYVIGPFPNPNRINIRRKFPPESVIDLDATYIGKNGRPIKWEYEQAGWNHSAPSMIVPATSEQYGIWYAYSELFVDRDCDLWIAVGSDDRSDVWINGLSVWGSSNDLKAWRVDEGFRKVHLRKGRNKILYRVENGWYSIQWSMCIRITEQD